MRKPYKTPIAWGRGMQLLHYRCLCRKSREGFILLRHERGFLYGNRINTVMRLIDHKSKNIGVTIIYVIRTRTRHPQENEFRMKETFHTSIIGG